MLEDAEMLRGFWPEAHEYANYVRNRSPTKSLTRTTPNEVFHGQKPNVATLRIFGSRYHVRIPPKLRRKLDSHSIDGILCGFEQASKAYKVWIPSKHKFVTSQDVIVYEKTYNQSDDDSAPLPTAPSKGVTKPTPPATRTEGVTMDKSNPTSSDNINPTPIANNREKASTPPVIPDPPAAQPAPLPPGPEPEPTRPVPRRSERVTRPSWKEAADKQAAKEVEARAEHKAQREARKLITADTATDPVQSSTTIGNIAQLAYAAVHGNDTPQNF